MKRSLKKNLLLCAVCLVVFAANIAGQPYENAGDYLGFINKKSEALTAKYLAYLSAVSHGKSARKVDKRRIEVVNSISDTRFEIMAMPPWKGDRSLKDTTVAYLKILNTVFNEDYGKIVNMEEIAEQSYDTMEAYLLAQQKAYEKLNEAGDKQEEMQKKFAARNNINLVENVSAMEAKSKIVSQVMDHCNAVYLVFFKPYKQEAYLMDAISKKNLVGIEQNLNSMEKFANEGMEKLRSLKGYNNDGSLIVACRNMMTYYKAEAKKGPEISDFFLKQEDFEKLKKQFDSKPANKRTKQDVDQFNNAVNNINSASNGFNKTMIELNKQGGSALNDWNKTYSKYMDEYMPKQSKQ